jgi:ABC-type multidrug transport system ATPase subunit
MVEIENLKVVFGSDTVLDDVSLKIPDGQVTVLVGANGSGKTTLFRSIAGAVVPTSGTVTVEGVRQDGFRSIAPVSYVSDRRIVWNDRTPRAVLREFARILGIPSGEIEGRVEEIAGRLRLSDFVDRRQDRLSTGQAARFSMARMLLKPWKTILLDEPSAGLDFEASVRVRKEMRRLADEGHAVLVTSHRLDEIVRVADRVVVLRGGRIVARTTPERVNAHILAFEALVIGEVA